MLQVEPDRLRQAIDDELKSLSDLHAEIDVKQEEVDELWRTAYAIEQRIAVYQSHLERQETTREGTDDNRSDR